MSDRAGLTRSATPVFEIERDRFALMCSRDIAVGECLRVVLADDHERIVRETDDDIREALDAIDSYAEKDMDHDLHALVDHCRGVLNVRETVLRALSIDLSGCNHGPGWRSVRVLGDWDLSDEELRQHAAQHHGVPIEQVGQPQLMTQRQFDSESEDDA